MIKQKLFRGRFRPIILPIALLLSFLAVAFSCAAPNDDDERPIVRFHKGKAGGGDAMGKSMSMRATYGGTVKAPAGPSLASYYLPAHKVASWHTEAANSNSNNSNMDADNMFAFGKTKVTANVNLYPKWVKTNKTDSGAALSASGLITYGDNAFYTLDGTKVIKVNEATGERAMVIDLGNNGGHT